MKYICVILISIFIFAGAVQGEGVKSEASRVREQIKNSETYFWLGIYESGNLGAFNRGLYFLEKADSLLRSADISDTTRFELRRRISSLNDDFTGQIEAAHDTYYGIFPLARFIRGTIFTDHAATGNYELIDDPHEIAALNAAESLSEKLKQQLPQKPQINVVFTSKPRDLELENSVLNLFNSKAKYYAHNCSEVAGVLSDDMLEKFHRMESWVEVCDELCRGFGIPEILYVGIINKNKVDDLSEYLIEAHLYEEASGIAYISFYKKGFCRDRRSQLIPIILTNIVLLLLATVLYFVLSGQIPKKRSRLQALIVLPIIGYVFGRISPWVIGPVCLTVAPNPDELAILSFWYPALVGLLMFIFPTTIVHFISNRLRNTVTLFASNSKLCGLFLAVVLGVGAYLSGPILLLQGAEGYLTLVPILLTGGLILFLVSQGMDKTINFDVQLSVFPLLFLIPFSVAIFHLSVTYLWICFGIMFAYTGYVYSTKRKPTRRIRGDEVNVEMKKHGVPTTVEELIRFAESPIFQKFDSYHSTYEEAQQILDGKTIWMTLKGPSGVGKTATANAVIYELFEKARESGQEIAVMTGCCPEGSDKSLAFAPFQTALANYFEINLLASPDNQLLRIDAALEGIFNTVVPFAGILFPPSEETLNNVSSSKEIYVSISAMIQKLCSRQPVILFIDDAHWIDNESAELLAYLFESLPPDGDLPLLVILTSRDGEVMTKRCFSHSVINLNSLNRQQRVKVLENSLNLKRSVINNMLDSIDTEKTATGDLFWLLRVVGHLAEKGAFQKEEDGFGWAPEYKHGKSLPIPSDYRNSFEDRWELFPEFQSVLECASCIGMEFNINVLAESLEKKRLEMLFLLRRIEKETGIIYDVPYAHNRYSFRSSFMLRIIREKQNIHGKGPKHTDVPQIIREYHARIAKSLEKTLKTSSGGLFEVANHFYAAGITFAEKAYKYCTRAAHSAVKIFDHDLARKYLEMAEECASVIGIETRYNEEMLHIECYAAHVEGKNRVKVADKCIGYHERLSAQNQEANIELLISMARACYDAGVDSHNQKYFKKAVEFGRAIVEAAQSPVDEAKGHHFIGISLPLSDRTARAESIRRAKQILEGRQDSDLAVQAELGRVLTSLAGEISQIAPDEAEKLYHWALEIKSRAELRDISGMARVHGGLGRLAFWGRPQDIQKAQYHFNEDLKLSRKTGDIDGQSMMESLLAACALKLNQRDEAIQHYSNAFQIAESDKNKVFAGCGLLKLAAMEGRFEQYQDIGPELLKIIKGQPELSPDWVNELSAAVEECRQYNSDEWIIEIETMIGRSKQHK